MPLEKRPTYTTIQKGFLITYHVSPKEDRTRDWGNRSSGLSRGQRSPFLFYAREKVTDMPSSSRSGRQVRDSSYYEKHPVD